MGNRLAELAEQMVDAAMLEVGASLGPAPHSYRTALAQHRAARKLIEAAVEARLDHYEAAAREQASS